MAQRAGVVQRGGNTSGQKVPQFDGEADSGKGRAVRSGPSTINDVMPSDLEIRGVVKALRNGRAGNTRGMKAEHLKQWLRMAENEEK